MNLAETASSSIIDIRPLKQSVRSKIPQNSKVRELILQEADTMPVEEFVNSVRLYLKLASME